MRNIILLCLIGLMVLGASVTSAQARGGRDDCAPNSTDPDCKDAGK